MTPYDTRQCLLGEGALWHPLRQELFWFDILNRQLHSKRQSWELPELSSAAGWIDRDTLFVATETRLARFDLKNGQVTTVAQLEAESPGTRSNDGRADPWGGFWIGTMGKAAEQNSGRSIGFTAAPCVP